MILLRMYDVTYNGITLQCIYRPTGLNVIVKPRISLLLHESKAEPMSAVGFNWLLPM